MTLTPDQIAQFQTEGWLFLPEVFDADEVALLKAEAEAIYAQQRPEVWREKNGAPGPPSPLTPIASPSACSAPIRG